MKREILRQRVILQCLRSGHSTWVKGDFKFCGRRSPSNVYVCVVVMVSLFVGAQQIGIATLPLGKVCGVALEGSALYWLHEEMCGKSRCCHFLMEEEYWDRVSCKT